MTPENSQANSGNSQAKNSQDRQALGILAETVSVTLGMSNIVTREVRRAYESGRTASGPGMPPPRQPAARPRPAPPTRQRPREAERREMASTAAASPLPSNRSGRRRR